MRRRKLTNDLRFLINMNATKKFSIGGLAILFVMIGLTGHAQEQQPPAFVVDEVISKVDNYIVLKSDLERSYQDYVTNGGAPSQRVRCQYLAMLVRSKLMLAKAEIDSVTGSSITVFSSSITTPRDARVT